MSNCEMLLILVDHATNTLCRLHSLRKYSPDWVSIYLMMFVKSQLSLYSCSSTSKSQLKHQEHVKRTENAKGKKVLYGRPSSQVHASFRKITYYCNNISAHLQQIVKCLLVFMFIQAFLHPSKIQAFCFHLHFL